ncbi:MAG: MBL fold metallo-hydrolase [Pseudomonadota bacterium]
MNKPIAFDRRAFLAGAAGFTAAGAFLSTARAEGPFGETVATEVFARLEKIGENIWAVVSTPLNDDGSFNPEGAATVCNGGLIAGSDRVVAIDGFLQPAGAAWLAEQSMKILGRPVTDVVVTHYHADHTGGLAGFQNGAAGPEIIATDTVRKLVIERYSTPNENPNAAPFATPRIRPVLPTRIITDEKNPTTLDLGGGRTLTLDPLRGHTPSDLAVRVDDAPLVFAGDLVWAGYFHNYVDAIPSALRRSAGAVLEDKNTIVVTGHGYVGKAGDMRSFLDLLDHVEDAAKASHKAGKTPAEGAADYKVPDSLGEWKLFNPRYYEVAFEAWRRELDGETQ